MNSADEDQVVTAEQAEPLNVAALRADDALVEQLAAAAIPSAMLRAAACGTADELIAMLAAWVAEVRPEACAPAPAQEQPCPA